MEMWCPDDIGRIAGIGLGRLLGGEHASTLQSGGGGSSPVKTASPDCIIVVVVVVEWLYYSKRIIIVRWADLSDFFSFIFVGKMCVFVSRPMKIVTFLRKNDYPQNGLLIFFGKETHSETKSWKSSRF